MKKLIWFMGLIISAAIFQGCQGNSSNNNNTNPTCPAGSWYSNGACYNPSSPYGTPSQYSYQTAFYADNTSGYSQIQIVNGSKMKELFKFGMGLCDRAANSYGSLSCDSYIGGPLAMSVQFMNGTSNQALVTIAAQPRQNPYYNYWGQLPSGQGVLNMVLGAFTGIWLPDPTYYTGATRNPLQLQMVISAINNSQGFEARGYGDRSTAAFNTLFALQVTNGKKEDPHFRFNFNINGVTSAQGTMVRYQ